MRSDFVRAKSSQRFARIEKGMTCSQVESILGHPDAARTHLDEFSRYTTIKGPGQVELANETVWGYGLAGQKGLPTLGQVWFNRNGQVDRAYGGDPIHQELQQFEETDLRQVLDILDNTPSDCGWTFNPLQLVRVVNSLQTLGKEKTLAAIKEYLRIAPLGICIDYTYRGLAILLRAMFEPAGFPEAKLGAHWFKEKIDQKRLPTFPLLLIRDIPLLLVGDYVLAGRVSIQPEIAFAESARLRSAPLVPTNEPLRAWDELWVDLGKERLLQDDERLGLSMYRMLVNQFLRLVADVYPTEEVPSNLEFSALRDLWYSHSQQIGRRQLCWDPGRNCYVSRQ